ncbi:hypothetical protein GCM10010182_67000 [Actinomadura cremea]|nr:hypothetical protein GCM10010182_67000 [Actinomadura cremea]
MPADRLVEACQGLIQPEQGLAELDRARILTLANNGYHGAEVVIIRGRKTLTLVVCRLKNPAVAHWVVGTLVVADG